MAAEGNPAGEDVASTGKETVETDKVVFQAGSLRFKVKEWRNLTNDKFILDMVQHSHLKFTAGMLPPKNKYL